MTQPRKFEQKHVGLNRINLRFDREEKIENRSMRDYCGICWG